MAAASVEEIELQGVSTPSASVVGKSTEPQAPRHRAPIGSPATSLKLPLQSYVTLDVLSQAERKWVSRLVVSAILDLGFSLIAATIAFAAAWKDSSPSLALIGLQVQFSDLQARPTDVNRSTGINWAKGMNRPTLSTS